MQSLYSGFSRRDFLKASGAGLLGLFLAELHLDRAFAVETPKQGRMTISGVELLSEPSFNAKKIDIFGRDEVVDISGEVMGVNGYGNPFNSTWYLINEGYAYAGWIQPVQTLHQRPIFDIPELGVLGELVVPFCDTRLETSILADRGYRIYYSSTHWITGVAVIRNEKSIWYKIYDRQIQKSLYVASHEMRLISPSELRLLSPEVP